MQFQKSLFIFRRDLRLEDNTALLEALKASREVLPCFIFDPRQIEGQAYKSVNALQFMIFSLLELTSALKQRGARLFLFYGKAEAVVARLIESEKIEAVFVNEDYTPFSRKRDEAIKTATQNRGVMFAAFSDVLLNAPHAVQKKSGGAYTVFTPFYKAASKIKVPEPRTNSGTNYYRGRVGIEELEDAARLLPSRNHSIFREGGRGEALSILSNLSRYKRYEIERNFPALRGTTGLSAHLKFGCVSIREVYHAIRDKLGAGHALLRQLYWRDFFSYIGAHFPHVYEGAFQARYNALAWENDRKKFLAWCKGRTGFPLVDAGMRELNTTGFMHNRVRMVSASFLVKDLHINWRWGERYFARKLVDYDPAVNNGNWQWAASTGCDAQPYFRIFNPWLQQKRFDAECRYIKTWVPELRSFSAEQIHAWERQSRPIAGYAPPLVDHAEMRHVAEEMFEALE